MAVTYHEIRTWARWLECFTARDLADSLGGVPLELGERGVKALLWHGLIEDTGIDLEGRDGPERLFSYVPPPPGPRVHPREPPPEVVVRMEMGGDPLQVPRGRPIAMGNGRARSSVSGQWRPGRRQGAPKKKAA